jgi:uncharacterized protein with FMN-binding domain
MFRTETLGRAGKGRGRPVSNSHELPEMKKLVLPLVIIAASGAYAWSQQGRIETALGLSANDNGAVLNMVAAAPISTTPFTTLTSAPAAASIVPVASTLPAAGSNGAFKDGSYQGSVADAYYGNVQVQANVKNGQLVSVRILQYPNDRNTSRYINSQALPMLKQEAIQAQTAQVDFISGATLTSNAFVQSLTAALSQAQAGSTI